jgi:hypothetical protein
VFAVVFCLAIESIHRHFNPVLQPSLDRLTHRIEEISNDATLLPSELIQYEVGEIIQAWRSRAYANPKSRVILPLEDTLDALEAVVTSRRPRAAKSEPAYGERHVVDQNEELLAGIEVGKGSKWGHRGPTPIHVGLWLENSDRHTLPGSLRFTGTFPTAELP